MIELMPNVNVWSPIIRWAVGAARWFGHGDVSDSTWQALKSILKLASDHFRTGFSQLQDGLLGVNVTQTVLHGAQRYLVPLYQALDLPDPELLVRELQEDLSSAFVEIDQIKTIVTKLLPNTSHHEAIMDLQEAFSTLTVQQMRWFLRRADTAGTHVRFATTWPLSVFVLFESLLLLAT